MVDANVEFPEDLTSVDPKGLSSLKTSIAKEFQKLQSAKTTTAEDLERMTVLRDQMASVRAEESTRAETQAANEAEKARLAAEMAEPEAEKAPDDAGDGGDATVTSIADAAGEGGGGEGGDAVVAEAEAITESSSMDALAASIASLVDLVKPAAAKAPARAPITTVARAKAGVTEVRSRSDIGNVTITAAAGIDTVEMGSSLDRNALSIALHERARHLPDQKGSGGKGVLVASIAPGTPKNDIRGKMSDEDLRIKFDAAHDVAGEGGLVASGGWCAPSETIYDFVCDYESMPEQVDLPTLTANRGGVRYPTSPLLGDVFDDINAGFTWTEADDIAAAEVDGPTKPCFVLPCPDFLETRLQAQGICVTAGNLTDRAYPELTNRYVDLVLTAHAHRMNFLKITQMRTNSTAVAPTVTDLSAAEAILAGIELQIACMRDEFFMSAEFVLEVVLPRWVRTVIRRDLARRAGVDFKNVTNAEIAAFFTEIGARVQFVSNWQSLRGVASPGCVTLPATVEALVYPAGAHTLLDGGSLDLGVVRDSTLNATNDYTAAWSEEFWALVTRCASLRVTIPLCANGSTGSPVVIDCPTA